jgi:hypothetical protein
MPFQTLLPRLAFGLVSGLLSACGGSSSETPPPARPDSWQLELRKPKNPEPSAEAAAARPSINFGREGRTPASTWGANKPVGRKPMPVDAGLFEE